MGLWNLYFAAKIYLYFAGSLTPAWWLNLLLALGLVVPLARRWQRVSRQVLAVVVGAVLIYHESNLPPIGYVMRQIPALGTFSPSYMLELTRRIITPSTLIIPVAALLAYIVINRWVRVSTFVMLALIVLPLRQGVGTLLAKTEGQVATTTGNAVAHNAGATGQTGSYDDQLSAFREAEKTRHINFSPMNADPAAQFDIIIVHICSLSWDDLDVSDMRDNPLFERFDIVFKQFSSASSYSGPAGIRLLRASCGQLPHRDLYGGDPEGCHLFADLAAAGYDVQALLNHDGRFDGFRATIEKEIGVPGVTIPSNEGLPMAMRLFDGSSIVGDYAVLERWYKARLARDGKPVALYFNTVSLHDGNRLLNSNLSSLQSYPIRLKKLLSDIDNLTELISRSGRKAAIVFVPEHGAALRGDAGQIAGMREIPTPRIVHVPVGIKLVGMAGPVSQGGGTISIDAPTSYLALAQLLSKFVADSPFRPGAPPLSQYAADLPQTRMIGENENTLTMTTANGYVIHTADDVWMEGK